jgi:hypothetical protein
MPDDTSPHGGEALHPLPDRARIPADRAGSQDVPPAREGQAADRPPLPDRPERMAADIEDEEADPVVESGPGVDDAGDGKPSVTQQPGG